MTKAKILGVMVGLALGAISASGPVQAQFMPNYPVYIVPPPPAQNLVLPRPPKPHPKAVQPAPAPPPPDAPVPDLSQCYHGQQRTCP